MRHPGRDKNKKRHKTNERKIKQHIRMQVFARVMFTPIRARARLVKENREKRNVLSVASRSSWFSSKKTSSKAQAAKGGK